MTRTSLSWSKGQRSRSPGRFTHRGVNASGTCSGERGNVLRVGTYCYVAVCRHGRLGGARRFGAHAERRGAGAYCGDSHSSLQLVTSAKEVMVLSAFVYLFVCQQDYVTTTVLNTQQISPNSMERLYIGQRRNG